MSLQLSRGLNGFPIEGKWHNLFFLICGLMWDGAFSVSPDSKLILVVT